MVAAAVFCAETEEWQGWVDSLTNVRHIFFSKTMESGEVVSAGDGAMDEDGNRAPTVG